MRKAYVSGALTGIPNPEEIKAFYEAIGDLCRQQGLEAYIPHQAGTDPIKNPAVTPSQVYKVDKAHVTESDLVVAYVGLPSLGVGAELGWAEAYNIPVILLAERGKKISRMILGMPNIVARVEFNDYNDGLDQLGRVLRTLPLITARFNGKSGRIQALHPVDSDAASKR